jgi:hypothetical protein
MHPRPQQFLVHARRHAILDRRLRVQPHERRETGAIRVVLASLFDHGRLTKRPYGCDVEQNLAGMRDLFPGRGTLHRLAGQHVEHLPGRIAGEET